MIPRKQIAVAVKQYTAARGMSWDRNQPYIVGQIRCLVAGEPIIRQIANAMSAIGFVHDPSRSKVLGKFIGIGHIIPVREEYVADATPGLKDSHQVRDKAR